MGFLVDLHLHTSRYSRCSRIYPGVVVHRAVRAGLDGAVITEHHHQWEADELKQLVDRSGHPTFLLLSAFEYTSCQGDILIYGLEPKRALEFRPGWPPERAADLAVRYGGVCIAAHPTRAGMSFDQRIASLPLAAIEVCSVNLDNRERHLARKLSESLSLQQVANSDAHDADDIGRYATEFDDLITSMEDLQAALLRGRFHVARSRELRKSSP